MFLLPVTVPIHTTSVCKIRATREMARPENSLIRATTGRGTVVKCLFVLALNFGLDNVAGNWLLNPVGEKGRSQPKSRTGTSLVYHWF
jgi:hypothetical protein